MNAKGLARLFARLLSGTHTLTMRGKLRTEAGKGSFMLEEARFDETTLPNFLVEEIISAVGSRQKPPFDPMQPSQMPYRIKTVGRPSRPHRGPPVNAGGGNPCVRACMRTVADLSRSCASILVRLPLSC